ncbi:aladin-like [Onthophagus taurus]|uniref:aladin-like n=1 Tax=Onthophagus taurus TaxID=166361 RepID=UPI000C20A059|nr:aladin-like [Onthophagus taurus]
MKNLFDFTAPPDNEITLCEVDGRVHSMNIEFANLNIFTNVVDGYPSIHITRESLHPIRTGEDAKELFIPVDVPFTKHLVQIFYEQGYMEALNVAANNQQFILSKVAQGVLQMIDMINKVRLFWGSTDLQSTVSIMSTVSQTRNWPNGIFRCIAWHFDQTKLAVGTSDDVVRIYSKGTNLVPILRCRQQRNISMVSWRPLCDSEIAVACETCIIVWTIDPNSVVTRPSVSNAIILTENNHAPIVSIGWNQHGNILASAAANDQKILMWDVEMTRSTAIKRPGGRGNMFLKWSLRGDKMFSATNSVVFRVWETFKWQSEKWNTLSGRVQTACWSPCGQIILFATTEESVIYALSFSQTELIFTKDTNTSPNIAIPLFDVTEVDLDGIVVGGLIQSMDWDPTGNHLAVLFRDSNYVTIFTITFLPAVQINASCLVAGAPEETPCMIAFQKNFKQGACLSIGWSSGRLQYFPIVYSDTSASNVIRSIANTY